MLLLRKIRRSAMKESKFTTYLLIGLGEILLVVIGILVAIQIDDWNRDRELVREELETYELIIADLRKDSILLGRYNEFYRSYLDTYFTLNEIANGNGYFGGLITDHIVSNLAFNTVTQNNHGASIDRLRDQEVREVINSYFQDMNFCNHAKEEFNKLIERETRPYFLKEQEVFNNSVIFNREDRTFPPMLRVSTLDTLKLRKVISQRTAISLISQLRMSLGYYLISVEESIDRNVELIALLESKLD